MTNSQWKFEKSSRISISGAHFTSQATLTTTQTMSDNNKTEDAKVDAIHVEDVSPNVLSQIDHRALIVVSVDTVQKDLQSANFRTGPDRMKTWSEQRQKTKSHHILSFWLQL
jgi:hypothetical protein